MARTSEQILLCLHLIVSCSLLLYIFRFVILLVLLSIIAFIPSFCIFGVGDDGGAWILPRRSLQVLEMAPGSGHGQGQGARAVQGDRGANVGEMRFLAQPEEEG